MYKKILIATDGSKFAVKAVTHGVMVAKASGGSVTIVTVTEMWSGFEMAKMAKSGVVNPVKVYEQAADTLAKKILAAAEAVATKAGVKVEGVHIRDTHPAEAILKTAASKKSNLIVLASHGRRGIEKVMLGSIAAEVTTHSNVPVLVVK